MTLDAETTHLLLLFALLTGVTYACRISGYWLMGRVRITPRVEAALRAAPLAVMIGIVVPAAVRGGVAEIAGLAAAAFVMWVSRSDLAGALLGVAAVAVLRAVS